MYVREGVGMIYRYIGNGEEIISTVVSSNVISGHLASS